MLSQEWARSLVGRDWEIFWNDSEENEDKTDEKKQDAMNQVQVDESHAIDEKKPDVMKVTDEKHDEKNQDAMNQVQVDESHAVDEKKPDAMKVTDEKHDEQNQDEMNQVKMDDSHAVDEKKQDDMEVDKDDDDDDNSEGSVIDDWYAGNVLSLESQDGDKFSFKVRFVGDETIYDMVLDPSKIRPSASGWIKRTTAILGCKTWETRLPPDTRTTEDNESLTNLQNELNAKKYLNFTPPEQKEGAEVPIIEDLQKILSLRYLLQAQIYLRSRLPTIVNHHGSTQYVDGEPNPRESYVDHLAQCCKDLDQVCAWYCRCWELLTTFFGETANSSSSKDTKRIIFEEVFEKYLEFGKDSIVSCATMDISPTASKRRLLPPPTSPQRRPKRRRKNARWGGSHASDLQNVANGEDLKSTAYVDGFVRTLKESTDRAYLPTCGRILQALSHFVVEPVENWKRQAGYLLGEQGEDEAGADDDDRDKSDSEEGDDDSNEDKESEYFMYEEIESCVAAIKSDRVLSLVDLTKEDDRLRKKLANIDSISMEATVLLSRTTEDTGVQSQGHDEVLAGLKRILKATQSPDHSVFNVEPIGRSGSKMTRDLLMGVIQTRALLIDVKHMELTRERSVFIQELSSRINQLAPLVHAPQIVNIVAIAKKLGEANMKITKMMDCLSNHIPLFRTILTEIEHRQNETNSLMSKDSAMEALKELGNCSVISLVEEKISIRVDVLDWNQEAKPTLETNGTNIGYAQLGRLHNLLQLILSGRSLTRMQILKDVQQNDMVESELKSFAFTDAKSICGPLVERVTSLFSKASKWKERAESTISTLQLHGNAAVGMALASPKPPAMVAFSRIHDLVEEYKSLQVEVPGYTATLQKAEEDAKNWSSKLHSTIIDSGISLERCHVFLEKERDLRPRGIIMDPTRHVFDSLLDALVWHKRVKDGMRLAIDELKALIQNDPSTLTAEKYSMLLTDRMYPLLVEGTDAVEVFAESRAVSGQFKAKSQHSVELLEELFHIRRSARALSREKLESHPLGSSILSRMVHADYDRTEGFPLLLMLWAQWHFFVAKFVSKFPDESSDDESEGDNPKSANTGSLAEAKELRAQQPLLDDCDSGISPEIVFLLKTDTTERLLLDRVIQEGGQIETEARELLLRSREMLRGGINKPDLVRQHLAELKESLATFKNRSAGVGGLLLSTVIERQVEHHIKIFAWMVSTQFGNKFDEILFYLTTPLNLMHRSELSLTDFCT